MIVACVAKINHEQMTSKSKTGGFMDRGAPSSTWAKKQVNLRTGSAGSNSYLVE